MFSPFNLSLLLFLSLISLLSLSILLDDSFLFMILFGFKLIVIVPKLSSEEKLLLFVGFLNFNPDILFGLSSILLLIILLLFPKKET